jgi:hypothetical protein
MNKDEAMARLKKLHREMKGKGHNHDQCIFPSLIDKMRARAFD